MAVTSIAYSNEKEDAVILVADDGIAYDLPWPVPIEWQADVDTWLAVPNVVTPYPATVPAEIEFRQLVLGYLNSTLINSTEAEAWAGRSALPAGVTTVVDAMAVDDRPAARIEALTIDRVPRDHWLIVDAGDVYLSAEAPEDRPALLDAFFAYWATL